VPEVDKTTRLAAESLRQDANRKLAAAKRADALANRERGGADHRISPVALANAVRTEGAEVLTPEAAGYWRDMAERHPHLRGKSYASSPARRAALIYRDGKWWRRGADGQYRLEPAPPVRLEYAK
jgi:hypothetical protein